MLARSSRAGIIRVRSLQGHLWVGMCQARREMLLIIWKACKKGIEGLEKKRKRYPESLW